MIATEGFPLGEQQTENEFRTTGWDRNNTLQQLEQSVPVFLEIIDEICEAHKETEKMFLSFAQIVIGSLEERTPCIRHHSLKVACYAERIAAEIGFDREERKRLSLAALLHDIGKISIGDRLLEKTTPDKILLGSDYPAGQTPKEAAETVQKLPLSQNFKEKILGKNAAKILKL